MIETVYLAKPRGFCAGVKRAIETVEKALEKFGAPIYVRHAIVHNEQVISDLESKGVIFVEDLKDVPESSTVIISAHGAPPEVSREAAEKKFNLIDATCPLVIKVHKEAERYHKGGYKIILIGKKKHQEVIGTMGYAPMILISSIDDIDNLDDLGDKIICLTQTTLSVDDTKEITDKLREKFPNTEFPPKGDICYATQNRQNGVRELVKHVDGVVVVGSERSSNSNKLVGVADREGKKGCLVSDETSLDLSELGDITSLGLTSGASTPEKSFDGVLERIRSEFPDVLINTIGKEEEGMNFILPIELRE